MTQTGSLATIHRQSAVRDNNRFLCRKGSRERKQHFRALVKAIPYCFEVCQSGGASKFITSPFSGSICKRNDFRSFMISLFLIVTMLYYTTTYGTLLS
jgi:hypothetical protein